jgi:DNA polymerase III subunit alpha
MERVENLREKFQSQLELKIKLRTDELSAADLSDMATLLSIHKGETPVKLLVKSREAKKPLRMNVRKYVVEPTNELLTGLREITGKESVKLFRGQKQN